MLSRPTTDQILTGIARDLERTVRPDVASEPTRVMVGMMVQLLKSCAQRCAHEVAWAHEEAAAIGATSGRDLGAPASLHLDDVLTWYHSVSQVLSDGVEAAYRSGDAAQIEQWRALIEDRRAHEAQILGALELVGRG
jgi:hypothetical protein